MDNIKDMMTLVHITRGYDNRPMHEKLSDMQAQNKMEVELQRMLMEDGGDDA